MSASESNVRAMTPRTDTQTPPTVAAATPRATMAVSFPSEAEWNNIGRMADALVKSSFLPSGIDSWQKAAAIILTGRELRLQPMQALRNIAVIKGRTVIQATLMMSLIQRDHGDSAVIVEESTADRCTISYTRPGWDKRRTATFTMEDAKRAELVAKGNNYEKYPSNMLMARCLSNVGRIAFADSILGMHTPEELGATVEVRDGETVIVEDDAPRRAPTNVTPAPAPTSEAAATSPTPRPKTERAQLLDELMALVPKSEEYTVGEYLTTIARTVAMKDVTGPEDVTPGYLRAMIDAVTQRAAQPTGPTRTVDMTTGEIIAPSGAAASATGSAVAPEAPSQPDASLPYVALRNKLDAAAALEPAARNAQVDTLVGSARALLDGGEITAAEYEAVSVRAEAISPVAAIGDVPF